MPLKPEASSVIFNASSVDYAVLIDDIKFSTEVVFFQRREFSNQVLRSAPEPDGTVPKFQELLSGKPIQSRNSICNTVAARSTATDDALIDLIYRRWDIRRWEIRGHRSDAGKVDSVFSIAKAHKVFLDRFEAHQQIANGFVSYEFLLTMQGETFSYLENTGVTMSGQSLGTGSPTSATNCLLVSFVPDVEYEVPLNAAGDSSKVLRSFSAVIEQRLNVPARSALFAGGAVWIIVGGGGGGGGGGSALPTAPYDHMLITEVAGTPGWQFGAEVGHKVITTNTNLTYDDPSFIAVDLRASAGSLTIQLPVNDAAKVNKNFVIRVIDYLPASGRTVTINGDVYDISLPVVLSALGEQAEFRLTSTTDPGA